MPFGAKIPESFRREAEKKNSLLLQPLLIYRVCFATAAGGFDPPVRCLPAVNVTLLVACGISISMQANSPDNVNYRPQALINGEMREGPPMGQPRPMAKPVKRGAQSSGPTIDWLRLVVNNLWLLILGLSLGLGAGYFHYSRQPAIFQSSARIQIVEPVANRNIPVEGIKTGSSGSRILTDESMVIRSEKILQSAATFGELDKTAEFSGLPKEVIAAQIATVSVVPADKGTTSVLQISYASTNPLTCQAVVQAVIDAYGIHLSEQYRSAGQETLKLIEEARDQLEKQIETLDDQFSEFRQGTSLVFDGDQATSLHRLNIEQYRGRRRELLLQKSQLTSQINTANQSIQAKRSPESILLALQGSVDSLRKEELGDDRNRLADASRLTPSQEMRNNTLYPLELEREELLRQYLPSHPLVAQIDTKIRTVKALIEAAKKREEEMASKLSDLGVGADEGTDANAEAPANKVENAKAIAEVVNVVKLRIAVILESLQHQLDVIATETAWLDQEIALEETLVRSESDAISKSGEFKKSLANRQELYDKIVKRLDEVNLLADDQGLKLFPLDTPKPGYQIAPSLPKSLLMGGFLGALIAGGLSLLRELSDRSFRNPFEITDVVGLPVVGHVPELSGKRKVVEGEEDPFAHMDARLCTLYSGRGRESEAFRSIRTSIVYAFDAIGWNKTLQITSSTPSDGKSTIAANVAIAMAQSGRSVLLLDADLRRPRVGNLFGIQHNKGVAWGIELASNTPSAAELDFSEAIVETPVPNLSVMIAGERPSNPSELLVSDAFGRMLESLKQKFDLIIIDTPPLLAVSDPSNVVRCVDRVLMVVKPKKNIKPLVTRAVRMLESLNANMIGIVVNGIGSRQAKGYGSAGYRYGYGKYGYGGYGGYGNGNGYGYGGYGYGYGGYGYGYGYGYGDRKGKKNPYSSYYEEDGRPTSRRSTGRDKSGVNGHAVNGQPVNGHSVKGAPMRQADADAGATAAEPNGIDEELNFNTLDAQQGHWDADATDGPDQDDTDSFDQDRRKPK